MHVTIVGGGFGGVKTALQLAKNKKNKITLITDKPSFQYYPALFGTATGGSHLQSWVPLENIFKGKKNVTIVIDTVTSIDPDRKIIVGKAASYEYNVAVFALGVVTTFFGIKGIDEYSYSIKSEAEIERFKMHVHKDLATKHQLDKHYVIIGAGPTGVELAGTLISYLEELKLFYGVNSRRKIHVDLVEASPRVLGKMPEEISRKVLKRLQKIGVNVITGKAVEEESADDIIVSGKPITTSTVVWTSGVTNHPFFKEHDHYFTLAPNGRVIVDEHMLAYKDVYVIGDNANTANTGLAQTALHDALFISKNFALQQKKQPIKEYVSIKPPVVIPVGENWAIVDWGWFKAGGRIGAMIRRAADFMGYHDILPLGQALGAWRAAKIREDETRFRPKD